MHTTAEHLRAAHDAAVASMDPSQRRALDDAVRAAGPAVSAPDQIERRLDANFRRQAAALNAQIQHERPA